VFSYLNNIEEGTGSLIGFDSDMLDMTAEVMYIMWTITNRN
jgi:hypothetical protein